MPISSIVRATKSLDDQPSDGIPEILERELDGLTCCLCGDPTSRFEMIAIWSVGKFVAHIACWASGRTA
jgi:hypothetical protein